MKIPIEFIVNDSDISDSNTLYYSLMSDMAARPKSKYTKLDLQIEFSKNSSKFSHNFILDILTRSDNMEKLLAELESMLKIKEYAIKQIEKREYQIFEAVPIDTIRNSIGQLELLRDKLRSKINSIYVSVVGYIRYIKHFEKSIANYSSELTDEVERLERIEGMLRAIDISRYEFKTKILTEVVLELEDLLNYYLQLDVYALGSYYLERWRSVRELIFDLNEFLHSLEARYEILLHTYNILNKDLTDLLKRAEILYQRMIDGSYIRAGDNVSISNSDSPGVFIVSASKKETMPPCAPLHPWYEAPDIIVIKEAVICPEQPFNSPLHPDFDPDPNGDNIKPTGGGGGGGGNPTNSGSNPDPTGSGASSSSAAPGKVEDISNLKNCNPDFKYWSIPNSAHEFAKLLTDPNGNALNPSNSSHYSGAKDFYKNNNNPKLILEDTTNFYYCITSAMVMATYPKLAVGNVGALVKGAAAYEATVSEFYKCLYQLFKTSLSTNNLEATFKDWATFNGAATSSGLTPKYNKAQLVSFFLTYRWQTVCDVQSGFEGFINDAAKVDAVANVLNGKKHACQRVSFAEAFADADTLGYVIRMNGSHLRILNMEPGCQSYDSLGAAPVMFGKGQFRALTFKYEGGSQFAATVALFSAERVGKVDPTIADKIVPSSAIHMLYVLIHESAHSIDAVKGIGSPDNFGFSTTPSWTAISGWKKSGTKWTFSSPFKYPSEVTGSDLEPPCTEYGCTYPWEDFAEAWTYFVFSPASFKKWYPKKSAFMTNNVVPYLNSVRR